MNVLKWAAGLPKNKKRILIPMVCAVGIFLALFTIYYFNNSSRNEVSDLKDQPLQQRGLDISAKIESLAKDKKMKGGSPVKVTIKVSNSSQQQSRYLTVKSGFQKSGFTYLRNVSGTTGVTTGDGEITFVNIVMQPQQTQEISFEADLFPFDDKEFTAKPSLIDTTGKTVIVGDPVNYIVSKGSNPPGGNISLSAEEAQ